MLDSDLIKRLKGLHLAVVQHEAAGKKLSDDVMSALDIEKRTLAELYELKEQVAAGTYPSYRIGLRISELEEGRKAA